MGLILGKYAIADALVDSISIIKDKASKHENSDNSFTFKEMSDGSNVRELFSATINTGEKFSDTVINITSPKISLKDLRKVIDEFLEDNGDCTIIVP